MRLSGEVSMATICATICVQFPAATPHAYLMAAGRIDARLTLPIKGHLATFKQLPFSKLAVTLWDFHLWIGDKFLEGYIILDSLIFLNYLYCKRCWHSNLPKEDKEKALFVYVTQ